MIEEAIIQLLLADAGVSPLVGTRVYGSEAPQRQNVDDPNDPGATPYIVLQRLSTSQRPLCQDGPIGVTFARTEIQCWAQTGAGAKALARAVLKASDGRGQPLHGWKQALMAGLVFVQMCKIEGDADRTEPPQHGEGSGRVCVIVDAVSVFNE